jgi:hypothetical protein
MTRLLALETSAPAEPSDPDDERFFHHAARFVGEQLRERLVEHFRMARY